MSRCFPYPPPAYACNRQNGGALIESIKIEKDKEVINQRRKELKRTEKEQKKKEKKVKKEKERLKSDIQIADGSRKRKQDSDGYEKSVEKSSFLNLKHVYLQKEIEPEGEQLERSSLTEEYGQPIVTEKLCYSSDGSQSKTKKCKIEQPPPNGNSTTQSGKVLRFRLKKREPENARSADDIPSTSGRTDFSVPNVVKGLPVKDGYAIRRPYEQLGFNVLPSVRQESGTLLSNILPPKKVSKPKSAYESLFIEWVPPLIHFDAVEVNDDDENWLLPSKKQTSQDRANLNSYEGLSGLLSMSLQPHAYLLPEVDLYALPYTVLF